MRRVIYFLSLATCASVLGMIGTGEAGGAKPTTIYARMTIMDVVDAGAGTGLSSDGSELYTDYHLGTGDPCVSVTIASTGYAVGYTNRVVTDSAAADLCNSATPPAAPRSYKVVLPRSVCDTLGAVYDGVAASATTFSSATGSVPTCTLQTVYDYSRLILGYPFASRNASGLSNLSVVIPTGGGNVRYSLEPDAVVQVGVGTTSNTRTESYGGTARLYQVVNGSPSSTPATQSFAFPFQIQISY